MKILTNAITKNLSTNYTAEQRQLEAKISELNGIINASYPAQTDRQVEVHEPEDVDGKYIQKLDAYYKNGRQGRLIKIRN